MFPMTITIHTAKELQLVAAALNAEVPVAGKPASAASGPGTAKDSAAPEKTAKDPSPAAASAAGASSPSTAATSEGNAAAASSTPAAAGASTASSSGGAASPEVSFEQVKKAFLALSTKPGGRALCEGVLKPFGLAKLSEAKAEQYAAVLTAINKAGA